MGMLVLLTVLCSAVIPVEKETGVFGDFVRPQLRLSTHTVCIHTVVHPLGFSSTPHNIR